MKGFSAMSDCFNTIRFLSPWYLISVISGCSTYKCILVAFRSWWKQVSNDIMTLSSWWKWKPAERPLETAKTKIILITGNRRQQSKPKSRYFILKKQNPNFKKWNSSKSAHDGSKTGNFKYQKPKNRSIKIAKTVWPETPKSLS